MADQPMSATAEDQSLSLPNDDGAASLFEAFLLDREGSVDRGLIRRVVREAEAAFPGDVSKNWWRWIGEAGTNLGFKCKVVDCATDELILLARSGANFVVYVPGLNPWRAVTGVRGKKCRITRGGDQHVSKWSNTSHLHRLIGIVDRRGPVRCVVIEPSLAQNISSDADHHEAMRPLTRLLALLKPEQWDIYILTVYSLVVGLLSLATPIAVDSLVSAVAFGRLLQPLVVLALLLFAFLAFSAALRTLKAYLTEIIQCRLFARVAADLSYRVPRIQLENVEKQYLPELVNRFFDIVTVQKVTAVLLLDGLQVSINAIVGLTVLAFYHPWLLGFAIVLLAFLVFIVLILGRDAISTSIKESKCKYKMAEWLEDLARCPVAFRLDGGAEFALERGDQLIHDYLSSRRRHFRLLIRQVAFALGLQALASAALLGIGGWLVMKGQLTLGQLVAAELIVTVIVGSFAKLGKSMESFYDLLAATDKLGALFDLPMESQLGVLNPFPVRPATLVVHHGLDYSFSDGSAGLEAIAFEIRSGERVAIAGTGKSVLLDLVFGIRKPAHGHVTVDGIDIRDVRPDILRRRVALVRGIEVFHGSVADNVHLSRPNIADSDVRDSLELVGLLDGISQLADGIATELTSGGAPLTETQLRRLMLARAIAGRPGLLLIDGVLDAFSDEEGEEQLRMLCDTRQPWTLVLVTNRTAFQNQCGRVIELGADSSLNETPEGDA